MQTMRLLRTTLFFLIVTHGNVYCTRIKSATRAWVAPYQIAGPRVDDEPKPRESHIIEQNAEP